MSEKERELGNLSEFKKIKPLEQEQSTIDRIHAAISKLKEQGTKVTSSSIAKEIRVSRQRVHEALQRADELYLLPNKSKKIKNTLIAKALMEFDTSHLSINDIHKLPIDGLGDISFSALSYLLKENGIPHSFSLAQKLSKIDTTNYTAKELHEMVGGSFSVLRSFLYEKRIPFKGSRRKRMDVAAILGKLRSIDTSQYKAQELHKLIDKDGTLAAFCNILSYHKVPHKSATRNRMNRRNREEIATLLEKLKTVDTRQYTSQELYEIFGESETLRTFRHHLRIHNIPYKKIRGELAVRIHKNRDGEKNTLSRHLATKAKHD
ncbi:hypothetical protein BPS26883_00409 [Burkholderia pseudomultivorans]|jgi:hypothetical protein|uniref:Uncharacterized protein n=1 Tax=Burkholderia pseudomultivorans TaxID=1207504 RepID=A0A6P2H689_9BURK|nr:hypothetical protein [Burkholderia pseudomultivorans]VWB12219.1 hypothetical protein BPS26883_00409 [Burkholderia pseudomultivorans]